MDHKDSSRSGGVSTLMSGIQIKVTVKGAAYLFDLVLGPPRIKLLLSVPKGASLDVLKEKITEKLDSKVDELNSTRSHLVRQAWGGNPQFGDKITHFNGHSIKLQTPDGYDIDEDSSLADFFGTQEGISFEVVALVNFNITLADPKPEPKCCVIS
jgi:hypothetical protein